VLPCLRSALGIAAARGLVGGLSLFQPRRTARLLAIALRHGIEPEHTRRIIRQQRLAPPEDESIAPLWPVHLRIRTLGSFGVEIDGQALVVDTRATRRPLEVLKALVGLGPSGIGFDALCTALWPDQAGDAARNACHVAIHRLRRLLRDDAAIEVGAERIALSPRNSWIDVEAFRRRTARLREDLAAGTLAPTDAERWCTELLGLYPGHFLPDEERPWIVGVRERLRSRFMRLADALSAILERASAWDAVIQLNGHVIELDPHAEGFHRSLMRGLIAQGRKAEALDAFARCRALLHAGLQIEPSSETQRLYAQIRAT